MANNATSKAGREGGLGDILSMALMQTGVESMAPPQISLDSSSILNAAANTLDSSLLSTDIGVLTEGLFSTLAMVREGPSKPQTVNDSTDTAAVTQPGMTMSGSNQVAPSLLGTTHSSLAPSAAVPTTSETATHNLNVEAARSIQSLTVTEPPSEAEVKTAQLLKAELQNSCMDDDIDLDELLSAGDVNADVNHISLLDMDVNGSETLQSASNDSLKPPTINVASSGDPNTSTTDDDLSSLLNMAGSQYLESLDTQVVTTRDQGTLTGEAGSTLLPSNSACEAPSIVRVLTTSSVTSTAPSNPRKATINTTPLMPTTSVTPSPTSLSPSTSVTNITKSTTNSPKTVLPTTKLDITAILREVTQMSPASIAVSTSPLTSTVSVTVVPSATTVRVGAGLKPQGLVSLPRGVPLVAKAPLALASQRYDLLALVSSYHVDSVRLVCIHVCDIFRPA